MAALVDADIVAGINTAMTANAATLTPLGITQDTAGFEKLMDVACKLVAREGFGAKAAAAQSAGQTAQSQAATQAGQFQASQSGVQSAIAALFQ